MEVPDDASIGAELVDGFTVAAWFRSDNPLAAGSDGARMLEKGNDIFFLQGLAEGGMNFLVKNASGGLVTAGIGESIEAGAWQHIAGTYDGAEIQVFLDGELKGTQTVEGGITDDGLPLRIGADDSGSFFDGAMDEVAFWDRALDRGEILQLSGNSGEPLLLRDVEQTSLSRFAGMTVTLSVDACGQAPLSYRWLHDGDEMADAIGPTLTLAEVTPEDAGDYRVEVSNEAGTVESSTVTLSVTPVEDISTGQVAFWPFDESSGLAASDSSGNGRTAELLNYEDDSAPWVSGQVGGALQLDGETNAVTVAHDASINLPREATFTFWMRPTSYGTEFEPVPNVSGFEGPILRKGGHFEISLVDDPSGVRETVTVDGANAPQGGVALDTWQHIAIVYKQGQVHFYQNGFQVGQAATSELDPPNEDYVTIGWQTEGLETPRYFGGSLDEVGIWERPLNPVEILELAGRDVEGLPEIVEAPTPPTKLDGTSVSFSVRATGRRLMIEDLSVEDAGDYAVRVTNEAGEATSESVRLEVEAIGAITTGLVGYWSFDEVSAAMIADGSGNGNDGELQNFASLPTVEGPIGSALEFDGQDDFIVVSHSEELNLTDQATLSFWVRPMAWDERATESGFGRVVRKAVNYDVAVFDSAEGLTDSLLLFGENKTPFPAPSESIEFDVWQHITVVIDDGTIHYFKNGEALAEPQEAALGAVNDEPLVIGNFQADLDVNRVFGGRMDDLGIWQRALQPSEIEGIYQNGQLGRPLTEEFEPLTIRSLEFISEDELRLVFFSPFPNRQFVIEHKGVLGGEWSEQSDVSMQGLGEGEFEATFQAPVGSPHYYRVRAMPPPPIFETDFEDGASD